MNTVNVQLNNGEVYEMSVENLTAEMVFELLRTGEMSFQRFDEWRSNEYFRGLQDGQELAGNY